MSNVWNIPEGATHWHLWWDIRTFYRQKVDGWEEWKADQRQWEEKHEDYGDCEEFVLPVHTLYNKVVPEDVWAVDDIEPPLHLEARLFTGDLVLLRILLTRAKWLTITPHMPLEWQEKIFPILLAKHRARMLISNLQPT